MTHSRSAAVENSLQIVPEIGRGYGTGGAHVVRPMQLAIAFRSHLGPRDNLEDAVFTCELTTRASVRRSTTILLLFAGAGGQHGGKVAAGRAVPEVSASLAQDLLLGATDAGPDRRVPAIRESIARAFARANDAILQEAACRPELSGMATTAVCGVIEGNALVVGWLGDSRCYLYRAGSLTCCTRDHRPPELDEMVSLGLLDADESRRSPLAHTITHYLGRRSGCEPEFIDLRLEPGDVLLLCSDGLTDVVPDEQIGHLLRCYEAGLLHLVDLPDRFVQHALRAGTGDNVTVLLAHVVGAPQLPTPRRGGSSDAPCEIRGTVVPCGT
jgi:protein phosphatase